MGSVCVSLDILKKCNYRVAVSGVSGCARFLNRLSKKNINNLCAKIFFLTHTHTHTCICILLLLIIFLKTLVVSSAVYTSVLLL